MLSWDEALLLYYTRAGTARTLLNLKAAMFQLGCQSQSVLHVLICTEMKTIPRAIPAQFQNDTAECLGPTELPSLASYSAVLLIPAAEFVEQREKQISRSDFFSFRHYIRSSKRYPKRCQNETHAGAGPPVSCFSVKCRLCLFPSAAAHSLSRGRRSCSSVLVLKTIPKTIPKRSPRNCGCRRARGVASVFT